MDRRIRVLFVAEAVTLAHVARPLVLARALDDTVYDIHFAHCPRYRGLLGDLAYSEHVIESITPQQFMNSLAAGKPLYDMQTLVGYVEEDTRLLDEVDPDIVVGDFRLSLGVSAELAGIPYITVSNAYWSPYVQQRYTVPELPVSRLLGPGLGQLAFSLARRPAFMLHCLPMRRVRRRFGLRALGADLRTVYTHADWTLYADIPEFYPHAAMPQNHRFLGPVVWSPQIPTPQWWGSIPAGRPVIYVTLGSSGQAALLPEIVTALGSLDVTALVSTAGAPLMSAVPDNVFMENYLPGEAAVARSSLVICNGGSPTTQQALAGGVPVLGLAGNLDQYLNMSAIVSSGAGTLLRSGTLSSKQLVSAIRNTLDESGYGRAARAVANKFALYSAEREFCKVIAEVPVS